MNTTYKKSALLAAAVLLALPISRAQAGHSSYLQTQSEVSLRAALGGRDLPLMKVQKPKGGPKKRMVALTEMLGSRPEGKELFRGGFETTRSRGRLTIRAAEGRARLEILGDGSSFRYRGAIDTANGPERPAEAMSARVAEKAGRDYVAEVLAPFLPMGEAQEIVFLGTKVVREGSFSEAAPYPQSWVVANIAMFGREVNGAFVAGPGSKIAVWMANDGTPVGFDVDWPSYESTSKSQRTLKITEVWDRMGRYADSSVDQMQENLSRFECGYVDLGASKRPKKLQAGCAVHHDGPLPEGLHYASVDVIPVGDPVVSDRKWPVTKFVKKGAAWDLCKASKSACRDARDADPAFAEIAKDFDPRTGGEGLEDDPGDVEPGPEED